MIMASTLFCEWWTILFSLILRNRVFDDVNEVTDALEGVCFGGRYVVLSLLRIVGCLVATKRMLSDWTDVVTLVTCGLRRLARCYILLIYSYVICNSIVLLYLWMFISVPFIRMGPISVKFINNECIFQMNLSSSRFPVNN